MLSTRVHFRWWIKSLDASCWPAARERVRGSALLLSLWYNLNVNLQFSTQKLDLYYALEAKLYLISVGTERVLHFWWCGGSPSNVCARHYVKIWSFVLCLIYYWIIVDLNNNWSLTFFPLSKIIKWYTFIMIYLNWSYTLDPTTEDTKDSLKRKHKYQRKCRAAISPSEKFQCYSKYTINPISYALPISSGLFQFMTFVTLALLLPISCWWF